MTPAAIVFLDIDGVLLPIVGQDDLHDPSLLPSKDRLFPNRTVVALSRLFELVPLAQIVLSSTWRVHEAWRNDILHEFQTYGDGPLSQIQQFYDITDPTMHSERQHEIYQWLRLHGSRVGAATTSLPPVITVPWIALDDEDLVNGKANAKHRLVFDKHVIHCDSKIGLTLEQAEEAVMLLQSQLSSGGTR